MLKESESWAEIFMFMDIVLMFMCMDIVQYFGSSEICKKEQKGEGGQNIVAIWVFINGGEGGQSYYVNMKIFHHNSLLPAV